MQAQCFFPCNVLCWTCLVTDLCSRLLGMGRHGYRLVAVSDLLVVIMVKSEALARDGVMTMKLDDSFNGAFLLTAVCLRVSSQVGRCCPML